MADPVSGVAGGKMSQHLNNATQQAQQNQGGGRSFDSVLQEGAGDRGGSAPAGRPPQAPGTGLPEVPEQARLDLIQRAGSLPPGTPNVTALLADLLYPRTKMNAMRPAVNGMGGSPEANDVRGQFAKVEGEWNEINGFLKSYKGDLSQGDLLFWQQRLYQITQHVEVMSKVVDQATGGIKTILNTNV